MASPIPDPLFSQGASGTNVFTINVMLLHLACPPTDMIIQTGSNTVAIDPQEPAKLRVVGMPVSLAAEESPVNKVDIRVS